MSKREITHTSKIIAYPKKEASEEILYLLNEAKTAAKRAYAPYSEFQVGAAVLLQNGKIVLGNNQENAAYPSGLCAERVACFSAKAQYPDVAIQMIAIVAKKAEADHFRLATPCGSCRQSMSEYENNQEETIVLLMEGDDGQIYESDSIENLLPFKFSGKNLQG